jgi:hypothetical protein
LRSAPLARIARGGLEGERRAGFARRARPFAYALEAKRVLIGARRNNVERRGARRARSRAARSGVSRRARKKFHAIARRGAKILLHNFRRYVQLLLDSSNVGTRRPRNATMKPIARRSAAKALRDAKGEVFERASRLRGSSRTRRQEQLAGTF